VLEDKHVSLAQGGYAVALGIAVVATLAMIIWETAIRKTTNVSQN